MTFHEYIRSNKDRLPAMRFARDLATDLRHEIQPPIPDIGTWQQLKAYLVRHHRFSFDNPKRFVAAYKCWSGYRRAIRKR
jgi:hypothetical protein